MSHPLSAPPFLAGRAAPVVVAGVALYSAFQPIMSVAHGRIVGQEALVRGLDPCGVPLVPSEIFERLHQTLTAEWVQQVCAEAHLQNFVRTGEEGWLFLNVCPSAMGDRRSVCENFRSLLRQSGIGPERVVVEIIETKVTSECLLAEAVGGFRELGCLVAIDDFGAGESNFERIWRLRPDLVKIDRAMIADAEESRLVRRLLPGLVSLLHEAGCLVVVEGIETKEQALIAMECDVDFVQGYYFARPSAPHLAPMDPAGPAVVADLQQGFRALRSELRRGIQEREALDLEFFRCFIGGFEGCMGALEEGADFFEACSAFLAVSGVQRVYQLDELGYQWGANAESNDLGMADPRFAPCAEGAGANWSRRAYFQSAVRAPRRVQISQPYLSLRDARNCVTISVAFETEGGLSVLCADVDYDVVEPSSERFPRASRIMGP